VKIPQTASHEKIHSTGGRPVTPKSSSGKTRCNTVLRKIAVEQRLPYDNEFTVKNSASITDELGPSADLKISGSGVSSEVKFILKNSAKVKAFKGSENSPKITYSNTSEILKANTFGNDSSNQRPSPVEQPAIKANTFNVKQSTSGIVFSLKKICGITGNNSGPAKATAANYD
jgi:hypothetical protein